MDPEHIVLSVRMKGDAEGPQTGDVVLEGSSINEYKAGKEYERGDVFIYDEQFYQALVDFTAREEFTEDQAVQIGIPDIILENFQPNTDYKKYQFVAHEGNLYRAKTDFRSGSTWQASRWEKLGDDTYTFRSPDGTVNITTESDGYVIKLSVKQAIDDAKNEIDTLLNTKVDKESGKGLSSNDFTQEQVDKLAALLTIKTIGSGLVFNATSGELRAETPTPPVYDSVLDTTSTNAPQNKAVAEAVEHTDATVNSLSTRVRANEINIQGLDTDVTNLSGDVSSVRTDLSNLAEVARTGNYQDLLNIPAAPGNGRVTLKMSDSSTSVGSFTANQTTDATWVLPVAAGSLVLTMDADYVLHAQLKDQLGNNLGSEQTINLPLETFVVDGSYDSTTKKLILTLRNGTQVEISLADLVNGLQKELEVTYDSINSIAKLEEKS